MNPMEFNFSKFYQNWKFVHSFTNLIGMILATWLGDTTIWLFTQIVSFSFLLANISKSLAFKPLKIGYANCVTLFRLLIVLCLGFLSAGFHDFVLFAVFLFAICLDGIDGFLARKFNQSSKEGEIFDMEVDSFMVLLLCWIHYSVNGVGWWILIPGSLRYSFEFINLGIKNHGLFEVPKRVRSTVAVIFFLSLLIPFIFDQTISDYFLVGSSFLIFLSFFTPIFILPFSKLKQ